VATLIRLRLPTWQWLALLLALYGTSVAAPAVASDRYGPIQSGDTLWQLSSRLYPGDDLTRDQAMLALLAANPEAFSPVCNLYGTLKTGALLKVPSPEQAARLDPAAAAALVQRQRRAWAEHRRSGQPILCPAPQTLSPLALVSEPAVAQPLVPEARFSGDAVVTVLDHEPPQKAVELGTTEAIALGLKSEFFDGASSTPRQGSAGSRAGLAAGAAGGASADAGMERGSGGLHRDPVSVTPEAAHEGGIAPVGMRAPVWAMVALFLALVAVAMVRWERRSLLRRPAVSAGMALAIASQLPRRAMLMLSSGQSELYLLLLMATLAGLFGALVTVLFREGIRALEWLGSGQEQGLVAAAEALSPWQRLLMPVIGGLVAGIILQQVGGWLKGRSSTDYMEAVAVGDGWISVRHSLVKAGSSLVTVASGGSIGREGAMVQLAAMVASAMGRIARFPRDRLRLLVAAGAAAGLASAYNAPIAATLFVAEIVLGSIALEHIGPLIIAAVIANTTVHEILGYAPVYQIPAFRLVSDWELALYLVLGMLAGHLGPVFLSLLSRSHQLFGRLPMPLAGRMALGGLIVGVISVYEPQVWGNGYSVVNAVLQDPWAWQALLTVLVLKIIATAATHGSGAVGGAFTPTIFVGAMLGALFGTLVHTLLPDGTATPSAYAVVGMGAMLAGTTHAPLMSILMVFELTLDYQIVLPLMLAVITAHYTARRYTGVQPMYAESLLPREKPT
jgi:FimV-like protein